MVRKLSAGQSSGNGDALVRAREETAVPSLARSRPAPLVDPRVVDCGDLLEQLRHLPDACVDIICIDALSNSHRNWEAFWGETKVKRPFENRHAGTQPYIDLMRSRRVEPVQTSTMVATNQQI